MFLLNVDRQFGFDESCLPSRSSKVFFSRWPHKSWILEKNDGIFISDNDYVVPCSLVSVAKLLSTSFVSDFKLSFKLIDKMAMEQLHIHILDNFCCTYCFIYDIRMLFQCLLNWARTLNMATDLCLSVPVHFAPRKQSGRQYIVTYMYKYRKFTIMSIYFQKEIFQRI